jgi:predicted nucleic acid-binding protein
VSRHLYVETSALLRALLDGDERLQPAIAGEGLYTSALTLAEAARALVRVKRERRLGADQLRIAQRQLAAFERTCGVIPVDDVVLERAGKEFPVEPVRTLDGIHLATLLVLNTAAIDVDVLSCDSRVRENAEALGFRVLPAAE